MLHLKSKICTVTSMQQSITEFNKVQYSMEQVEKV